GPALRPVQPGGSREWSVSCGPCVRIAGSAWASQTETQQRRRYRSGSSQLDPHRHEADFSWQLDLRPHKADGN
ncbi:MAG: hypothetical protein ACK58T_30720, partial [Phycisphaerae bacterium]